MEKNYIDVLKESLKKKLTVLKETLDLCKLQENVLAEEKFDAEHFDRLVNDKDVCIEKLEALDDGFETVYERVKTELDINKTIYADEIKEMQELISEITDISTAITAQEKRNKNALANALVKERKGLAEAKRSVNVAMNYYKNMSGLGNNDSQYINRKK